MSVLQIITLFGIMAALAAMPSSSVALVVTRSATLGVANGVAVAGGIVLGDLVFILLALFGLSVMAETMGSVFMVIKYLGAAYLLWLGVTLITSKPAADWATGTPPRKHHLAASFFAGFILTLGDIKAIIFYVSLFPAFIDLAALQLADFLTILLIMVLSVGGVKAIYAFSAKRVASLAQKHGLDNAARKTAGGLMVSIGGYLFVKG